MQGMRRLILRRRPDRDGLLSFFYDADWTYIREDQPGDGDSEPRHIGWVAGADDEWEVEYVDDHTLDVPYFVVKTRDADDEERVEEEVRNGPFDVVTREEVIKEFEAAGSADAQLRAFRKVALIAPEKYSPEFVEYVRRALGHQDAKVRAESIGLITYFGWPELKPDIEKLKNDPNANVRKNAQIVLEGFRELGIA